MTFILRCYKKLVTSVVLSASLLNSDFVSQLQLTTIQGIELLKQEVVSSVPGG